MEDKRKASVVLTDFTEPILKELKIAGWGYTEVLNAGIVAFSQLSEEQKRFFKAAAYGLSSDSEEKARDIFRNWILQIVADAQAIPSKKKHSRKAKTAKSG